MQHRTSISNQTRKPPDEVHEQLNMQKRAHPEFLNSYQFPLELYLQILVFLSK